MDVGRQPPQKLMNQTLCALGAGLRYLAICGVFGFASAAEPEFFRLNPGPWGEIEAQTIKLSASTKLLDQAIPANEETTWVFAEPTLDAVANRLRQVGLGEFTILTLLETGDPRYDGNVWRLRPTAEAIRALTSDARAALYATMRPLTVQASYLRNPIPIEHHDPVDWFSGVGLEPTTIELATSLCHRQGRSTVLSDVAFVLSQIESPEEKTAFRRAAEQTMTAVLRLRLTPDSDIDALATYWSNSATESTVHAMLETLQPRNGERWLDVSQLLPPMPRSRLYSFLPLTEAHLSLPDCRWTALNFFADLPSERLADENTAYPFIEAHYDPALPPYKFGDVIVIHKGAELGGQMVHTCVYIADDIVFTKNGKAAINPWIFQRDRHLSSIYARDQLVQMKGFRRRLPDS